MAVPYGTQVRCPSIFAKKYDTLVRYAFFVKVRERYASKIELIYGPLVWYGSRREVRSTLILSVPYRTAILDCYLTASGSRSNFPEVGHEGRQAFSV